MKYPVLVVELEPAQPKLELGGKDRIGRPNLLDSPADFADGNDAGEQAFAVHRAKPGLNFRLISTLLSEFR